MSLEIKPLKLNVKSNTLNFEPHYVCTELEARTNWAFGKLC